MTINECNPTRDDCNELQAAWDLAAEMLQLCWGGEGPQERSNHTLVFRERLDRVLALVLPGRRVLPDTHVPTRGYKLAFSGPGDEPWDVVEEFRATDDLAANTWAQANEPRMVEQYDNDEWYVLDADGENING